ncbi:MAG: tetratricopeptide repeat protein [Planctomycetaceae bacterium]|nr:tetratricopeptide repeat protein [Planctomycetaceae bacterium]
MPRPTSQQVAGIGAGLVLCCIVGYFAYLERQTEQQAAVPVVSEERPQQPPAAEVSQAPADHHKFVGSEQCRSCHQTLYDSYVNHPMAQSVRTASFMPPGSESAPAVVHGVTHDYSVTFQNNEMLHTDEMVDASGEPVYLQTMKMDYAVGSGQRAFAYLRQEGNLLFQSPLNWYTEQACWDIAPGYRKDDVRRFRRRVTEDCLSCHAGRVAVSSELPNHYGSPAFHEMRIGCERCHGPGLDHIQFQTDRAVRSKGDGNAVRTQSGSEEKEQDPIVNPGNLEASLRESVCNQCHVPAAARIVRHGKSEFSFRPGRNMNEFWTVLDAGAGVDESGMTQAVNHVQQMQQSRCYTASSGALGCISCHDPHSVPSPNEKTQYYTSRCMKCHESEGCSATSEARAAEKDSCIACHMPHRDSKNISHVTQTDHRIIRNNTKEDADSTGSKPLQLSFFDPADKTLPQWEQSRAMGVGMWSLLARKGQPAPASLANLLQPALTQNPDDGLVLATLGALALQHQQPQAAEKFFEKGIRDPVSRESSLMGLLEVRYQAGDWNSALSLVDQCIELDPGHPGLHAIRADVLLNLERHDDAVAAAKKSIELDPSVISVREWLLRVYEKQGAIQEADTLRSEIERMRTARSKGAAQ